MFNVAIVGAGPAGTGKTYLAVAMAVDAFRRKEVSRIILTRPAVEAGEKLGFFERIWQAILNFFRRLFGLDKEAYLVKHHFRF